MDSITTVFSVSIGVMVVVVLVAAIVGPSQA